MKRSKLATTSNAANGSALSSRERGGALRTILLLLMLGGIAAAVVWGLRPRPLQVDTAQVARGPLTVSVLEEGKTRIRNRYTISPPLRGLLRRTDMRAGTPIKAGETVLAIIEAEPTAYIDDRVRVEAEARVDVTKAVVQLRQSEIASAKTAVELAQKEFKRLDDLKPSGSIPVRDWDAAQNRLLVLERAAATAEFALRVAEFEVAQAEAALLFTGPEDKRDAKPITITSPIDGFVLSVFEENERIVSAGTSLMEIGDPSDLEAEIELLSSDAVTISVGSMAIIERWGGETPLRGRVSLIERAGFTKVSALGVEEQRVKVHVEFLDLPPSGRELGDRFRVEARIVTWQSDDVLLVPMSALFRRGNDWMVFVDRGGKAAVQTVGIARNDGVSAEVTSGLNVGDSVIVYPPAEVVDGGDILGKPITTAAP